MIKAYNTTGSNNMQPPAFPGYGKAKPLMLFAGNDAGAKAVVGALLTSLGWDAVDSGPIANSLHLEHAALLWIKFEFLFLMKCSQCNMNSVAVLKFM